jgi:Fe/S biogenesis protein NfuA
VRGAKPPEQLLKEEGSVQLEITERAQEKIRSVLESQEPAVRTIRVIAPFRSKYSMALEPDGTPGPGDLVLHYEGFEVLVDSTSQKFVDGASLNWLDTAAGGGFQFENPNDAPQKPTRKDAPEGPEGEVWRQIQRVLDEQVNPAVASHGGNISLIEYRDGIAYLQMGGGCQGCGQAAATLKQGVERILRDQVPEIEEILDVTDHAGGRNPYYAP